MLFQNLQLQLRRTNALFYGERQQLLYQRPTAYQRRSLNPVCATYLQTAVEATKVAGDVISNALSQPKTIKHKGPVDLVTDTDKESERRIFEFIKEKYPTHIFIGEERSVHKDSSIELTDAPTWMCDPLDGTTNFVHQHPSCCVSLALWKNREPIVGAVYNPMTDELFAAEKGKGAFKNGERIQPSKTNVLRNALFATDLGPLRDLDIMDSVCQRIRSLALNTRAFRCTGSMAIDLCNVACGRLDICFGVGFGGCWDVAAGALIVQEAGGKVCDPSGRPFHIMSRRILATNAYLHNEVLDITSKFNFYRNEPLPIDN
eukprot:g5648.t1